MTPSDTDSEDIELPQGEYVCIEPSAEDMTYSYIRGALPIECIAELESHLLACLRCQETVAIWHIGSEVMRKEFEKRRATPKAFSQGSFS